MSIFKRLKKVQEENEAPSNWLTPKFKPYQEVFWLDNNKIVYGNVVGVELWWNSEDDLSYTVCPKESQRTTIRGNDLFSSVENLTKSLKQKFK
jgi:hypothetical protein